MSSSSFASLTLILRGPSSAQSYMRTLYSARRVKSCNLGHSAPIVRISVYSICASNRSNFHLSLSIATNWQTALNVSLRLFRSLSLYLPMYLPLVFRLSLSAFPPARSLASRDENNVIGNHTNGMRLSGDLLCTMFNGRK